MSKTKSYHAKLRQPLTQQAHPLKVQFSTSKPEFESVEFVMLLQDVNDREPVLRPIDLGIPKLIAGPKK
jgi:hypothetical protein